MAHPDSVLLKNGDILTAYPKGHGKGAVLNRVSNPYHIPTWIFRRYTDKLMLISANSNVICGYGKFSPDAKIPGGKTLKTYITSKRINLKDTDELVKKYLAKEDSCWFPVLEMLYFYKMKSGEWKNDFS